MDVINNNPTPTPDEQQMLSNAGAEINAPATPASGKQPVAQSVSQPTPQPQAQNAPNAQRVTNQAPPEETLPQAHHSLVKSIVHSVKDRLAGTGTVAYRVNPQTQQMEAIRRPASSRDVLNGLLAAVVTGAFAGAQQRGPGANLRAFGAGGQAVAERNEKLDTAAKEQANADYSRQLGAAQANMQTMTQAMNLSRADRDDHDHLVEMGKSFLDGIPDETGLKGDTQVSEQEALDPNKYSPKEWIRYADGTIPAVDENGQPVYINWQGHRVDPDTPGARQKWANTYTMVHRNANSVLTENGQPSYWLQQMINKYGDIIPGANPKLLQGRGAVGEISPQTFSNMFFAYNGLEQLQRDADGFAEQYNQGKDKKDQIQPINIKAAFARGNKYGLTSQDAVNVARAAHGSGHVDDILNALQNVKGDSANKIRYLFNGDGDYLTKYTQNKQNQAAQQAAANKSIGESNTPKGQADLALTQARTREANAQANKANQNNPNSPANAALVDEIGLGKMPMQRLEYLLARNPELLSAVSQKYPDFDASKVKSYVDTYKDFTSGKTSIALNAGGTALKHLSELKDLNTNKSRFPGTADHQRYENKVDTVSAELARFYGTDTVPGIAAIRKTLDSTFNRDAAIETQAKSMGDKLDSFEQTWKNAAPSSAYQASMPGIDDAAKAAFAKLDPDYGKRIGQGARVVPTGAQPILRNGQTVGYILNGQRINF